MRITRPLVAVSAAALVAGLVATPAGAAVRNDPQPRRAGAAWLAGELTDGLVVNEQFAFADYGLSIDFSLGLRAAGRKPTVASTIADKVAADVTTYTSYHDGTYLNVYAGNLAKAAVLALANGKNPRSFGGQDLISQLEGRVATSGPIRGRIEDDYNPVNAVDFANVIGQAYAAQALQGGPLARAVRKFLEKQQCRPGFFRLTFTSDKSRADQSCNAAPKAERSPDTDATALAIVALRESKGDATTRVRIERAVDWLVRHQQANGSFGGGTSTEASNANSTGLAGYALGLEGRVGAARRAAVWLRGLQVPGKNPCARGLAKETGAIAYDAAAYRKGQRAGITTAKSDQWRRTSSQALPALRWAPRADGRFTASAPRTARAGEKLTIRLTGVAAGERVCVTEGDVTYEARPGRNPVRQVKLVLGDRTGLRTFKVWPGSVRRDVTVRVTR
jgi:hypothetical protein